MERSQSQKNKLYGSVYVKCPESENPQKQKINPWLPRAGGPPEMGIGLLMSKELLRGSENGPKLIAVMI